MTKLSDDELVGLLMETSYSLGVYAMMETKSQSYDMASSQEARDKMREDLLNRLSWLRERVEALEANREQPAEPEQMFIPNKEMREDVSARDVLLALVPAIWRATERKEHRSRTAAFSLIQKFNAVLRPMGFEYLLRPGGVIILHKPRKRWFWADETR